MRSIDFSPLFRSTVGFDRMQRALDAALRVDESALSYPPYNIEAQGDNAYRIVMAVAGFAEDDLEVTAKENTLVVSGKGRADDEGVSYLHRGIAGRSFERHFQLAEHIQVKNARLVNGLLEIGLVREVPEEMKPRSIQIETADAKAKTIAAKAA